MDSDLAAVIEAAVTEKLERLEAKRFAETKSPRKSLEETDTSPKSRYLPAAVRRFVSRRDGNQCRFVSETGRRCPERRGLEFHHEEPFGRGGGHDPDKISLMCKTPQHLFRRAGVWERVDEEVSEKRRGGVRDRAPVRHLGAAFELAPSPSWSIRGQPRHARTTTPNRRGSRIAGLPSHRAFEVRKRREHLCFEGGSSPETDGTPARGPASRASGASPREARFRFGIVVVEGVPWPLAIGFGIVALQTTLIGGLVTLPSEANDRGFGFVLARGRVKSRVHASMRERARPMGGTLPRNKSRRW